MDYLQKGQTMREYYIRCRATGAVVDCVTSGKTLEELRESPFYENDEYFLDPNPPMAVLSKYRYWSERP
jgi:hypothetical protein